MKKILTIGSYFGVVLIITSFLNYSINEVWDKYSTILAIAGILLAVGGIGINFQETKKTLSKKTNQYTANAFLLMIIFLCLIGLVNFMSQRHNKRWDLTANQQFSLSESTVKLISNLKKEIQIIAFYKEGENRSIKDLLSDYNYHTKKIKYQVVDPDKEPVLAKMYEIKDYGAVVVECGDKKEVINSPKEPELTSALIKVTREGKKVIYFSSGHGERDIESTEKLGMSLAKAELAKLNYEIKKLNIIQEGIPMDCQTLVIAGPQVDFFKPELDSVESYLEKRSGKVILLMECPLQTKANFNDFLSRWGMKADNDIVLDASGVGRLFGLGPQVPLVQSYETHPMTKGLQNSMSFYSVARSLDNAEKIPDGVNTQVLFKSGAQSWGETDFTNPQATFNANQDKRGPVNLAMAATKNKSKLVVVGDADFASNWLFGQQVNGVVLLNAVNWLAEEEDLISVKPKEQEDRRITLTGKQTKMVFWLVLVGMPVVVIGAGSFMYLKRRKS